MRNQPLPLIGQAYTDDARPWAMQDVVNWLPCAAETEGTRTATMCKTPPGLAPFVQVPDSGDAEVAIPAGPIRGLHNAEGRVFAVSSSQLWQLTPEGVAIPRGSIGGTSRVRMAHNQLTGGNELLIVNGSAGYLYNTQTQTLAAITDPGYPGAIDAVFLDGYFIQIEPARRYMFNSDLADGASYNTLDRFTSEVQPDRLVGLAVCQNELIAFSERSAEFFENTGAAQQPFRSKRISMKRGAASRYGQAELDNTVFWLGNDGKFYVLDGYNPKRVSTRPIEQAIRGLNWAQAFAFVWESEGHAVVYWTFPDGRTWGYDVSQGRWHRRASYGLDRWRVNCTAPGFAGGEWVAGDFQAGKVWTIEWGYPWEGDTEFVSELVAPVIHDHQNRVVMPRLEVLMDTGQPEVAPREFPDQPAGPTIEPMVDAPSGTVGQPYNPPDGYQWVVTTGDAPIASVSLRTGTLPPGMTMAASGDITGTPTTSGSYPITVRALDTNGLYDDAEDTLNVFHPLFVQINGSASMLRSDDGGATWNPVATGGDAVTDDALAVGWRSGQVLRQTPLAGRATTDGTAWTDCTVPAATSFPMWVIWTGSEWLRRSGSGLQASADGITFAERTFPSIGGTIDVTSRAVARRGAYIISTYKNATLNRVAWSGDAGATFSILSNVILYTAMVATANRFLAFSGSSGYVWYTETGAEGTWTFTPDLISTPNPIVSAAYSPTLDRVVAITGSVNEAFTSDDDGETWAGPFGLPDWGTGFGGTVVWAHDQFVLTSSINGTTSAIFTSPDGQVWTKRHEITYASTGYLTEIASL